MADLRFKIIADTSDLKRQLKGFFSGGGSSGGAGGTGEPKKEAKKQTTFLGNILKGLSPLAILLALKPVADLLKVFMNFAMLGIMKILKFAGLYESGRTAFFDAIAILFVETWDKLKDWFLDVAPRIWSYMKQLPALIWEKLKEGFAWIRNRLRLLAVELKMAFIRLRETFTRPKHSAIQNVKISWDKDGNKTVVRTDGRTGERINDAIITKDGRVLKPHADDTIIATKNPGMMGGNVTNNFYGVTPQEMISFIKRELDVNTRRSTRL